MTEWQRIGEVAIDTGRLVLVDPMNVTDVDRREEEWHERYEAEPDAEHPTMNYEAVTNEHGVAVALMISTGLGDGVYPVSARFLEADGAMRIAEVRIRFLPHPVIGYELPK